MAKGNSGLFFRTKGENYLSGINPDNLKQKAFEYAEEISKKGLTLEKRFLNTTCVVYDEKTDRYYYGMNHGIELHSTPKNVILFGNEISEGILPKKSLNDYPIGNCAEVDAINNALNNGSRLENLHIATLDVRRKNIRAHKIIGKRSCKNCSYAFKGRIKENYTGWEE